MMNSRSRVSRSSFWAALVVVLGFVCAATGLADAGKKRVVVLDLDGPKGLKFQAELVKLLKKSHTVVSSDKWNGTAEELDAADISPKNIKKVARKLKIDGVIEGRVEKRRDEFILHLKLHSAGGDVVTSVDTKADSPKLEGRAARDIKEELIAAVDNLSGGGGGGGDDEDEPVAKKGSKKGGKKVAEAEEEEEEDKPAKKGFSKHFDEQRGGDKVAKKGEDEEEEDKPAKKGAKKTEDEDKPAKLAKKAEDEDKPSKKTKVVEDEDKLPPKKASKVVEDEDSLPPKKVAKTEDDDDRPRRGKKKVAAEDEDGNELAGEAPSVDRATALSPGERFVDAALGLSVTARRLTFKLKSGAIGSTPPDYRGRPVPGGMFDITVYPLAYGHKRADQLKNLGVNVLFDKAFGVKTKGRDAQKMIQTLDSSEQRFSLGLVYRYAFGRSPMAPTVLGTLSYGNQSFIVGPANTLGIPNVRYKMFEPGVGVRFPVTPKIVANLDAKIMAITNAGQIQSPSAYGTIDLVGYEGNLGVDYMILSNVFARAAFHTSLISMKFHGNGTLSNMRDNDPATVEVTGARDLFIGGFATVGYVY